MLPPESLRETVGRNVPSEQGLTIDLAGALAVLVAEVQRLSAKVAALEGI